MTQVQLQKTELKQDHSYLHANITLTFRLGSCYAAQHWGQTLYALQSLCTFQIMYMYIITARCTIVQSAVLQSHVVCLSVTFVDHDHVGWKSWKCTISPTPSLFVAQRPSTYSQGNMGKFWGDYRWGGKVVCWSTEVAECLKRIQIEEKLLWRAYRNTPTPFRTVPSPNPYDLLSPKIGVRNPHPKRQSLLSQEWVKLRLQIWPVHSQGLSEQKPIKYFGEKGTHI